MSVTRRELEELKPWLEDTVKKRLGYNEKSVVNAAMYCVSKNLDKKSSCAQLSSLLDDLAPQFVEDLFRKVTQLKNSKSSAKSSHSRKRTLEDVFGDDAGEDADTATQLKSKRKQSRFDALKEDNEPLPPALPEPIDAPAPLNTVQISQMVASMKKQIEDRKKQLEAMRMAQAPAVPVVPAVAPAVPQPARPGMAAVPSPLEQQLLMNEAIEKAKRAAELQARIQAQIANKPSLFSSTGLTSTGANLMKSGLINAAAVKDDKPGPLILDESGRTVDATGKAVSLTSRMPTLKANIRAKKAEQFKVEKPSESLDDSAHFDARVGSKPALRAKRGFRFHEKGRFQQIAQRIRAKTQLEKLQKEIAAAAKKTGISSAFKLAMITPNKEAQDQPVPDVEWWDHNILSSGTYQGLEQGQNFEDKLQGITLLVEHPIQRHPPAEPTESPAVPIMLTAKERKKMRTQRRREAEKEKTEKIRLGLEPPPPPKVKISNLMRVLGSEAVQDPTKVEAHVRAQMAQRQKAHEAANAARKLTPAARREKTVSKLKEDTSLGVHCAVFRVRDMHDPQRKFKVDINAQQYYLTGCAVVYKDVNLVIVEGGPKAIKKFKRLMLHRIKWAEDSKRHRHRHNEGEDGDKPPNECVLVWEGTNKQRNFNDWKFKLCPTQPMAREHLKKYGVEHYWDLALSESLLEGAED